MLTITHFENKAPHIGGDWNTVRFIAQNTAEVFRCNNGERTVIQQQDLRREVRAGSLIPLDEDQEFDADGGKTLWIEGEREKNGWSVRVWLANRFSPIVDNYKHLLWQGKITG